MIAVRMLLLIAIFGRGVYAEIVLGTPGGTRMVFVVLCASAVWSRH